MWDMEKADQLREKGMISDENYEKIAKHYQKFKAASAKFEPQKMAEGGMPYPDAPEWDKSGPATPEQTANLDYYATKPKTDYGSAPKPAFAEPGDPYAAMTQKALDTAPEAAPENKVYNYAPPAQRNVPKTEINTPSGEHIEVSSQPEAKNAALIYPQDAAPAQPQATSPMTDPYADLFKGSNQQMAAEKQLGDIAAQKGKLEADAIGAQQAQQNKIEADRVAEQTKNQADIQNKMSDLNNQLDRYASQKIDPNHFWANASTGSKVAAGIGLFLGAFSQNGSNPAVAVINNTIDRDIKAQQANLELQGNALNQKKSLYNDMYRLYKDKDLAFQASKVAALDNTKLELQKISANYSGPEAKAKAQFGIGAIQKEQDALKLSMQQRMWSLQATQDPDKYSELLTPDQRERSVPGFYNLTRDKSIAQDVTKASMSARTATNVVNELIDIANMGPAAKADPKVRARAEVLHNAAIGLIKDEFVGSRLTDADRPVLEGMARDPMAAFSLTSSNVEALKTLNNTIQDGLNAKAQAAGLRTNDQRMGLPKSTTEMPPTMGKLTSYKGKK